MAAKKRAALASLAVLGLWFSFGAHGSNLIPANHAQSSPFVLPIVKRDSLLNGLQLITLEQQNTGGVTAHIRINSGGLFDLAGKGGLADITAGMLLKGAGGLSAKNLADTVEQLGLTVNATVGWDSTDIVIKGPADSLEAIFDLLGKFVIAPAFDQKELDAVKSARAATQSKDPPDDSVIVRRRAVEAVFGSNPFGRRLRGTVESIAQIARQDLVYFHNKFYLANNSELIVTGDATAEQVTRLARSKLGAWKKGEKTLPTFRPPDVPAGRRVFILDRAEEQTAHAAIAQIGVSRRAEEYFSAMIMTEVLGRHASKITAVHDRTAIEADLDARLLAGPMLVGVKSAPSDLTGDLEVILDAMTRMQTNPSNGELVESAKARLIASMAEQLKTTEGAAGVILDIETYGLGRDYVVTFADRVNAITPADVQRAAQTCLKPQSVAIVIAGAASRFENSMKKIGTVAVLK